MNILIVDDDPVSRLQCRTMLKNHFPATTICSETDSVLSAYEEILIHQPDVVLLDVNLTDGSAFDLLNRFPSINFNIIFITAHEEHAIRAFKFSALDYLLKPFTVAEFIEAIRKAEKKIEFAELSLKYNTLLQNFQSSQQNSRIILRTSDSIHVIVTEDIIRLEADGAYTKFYLSNRKPVTTSKNLKEYENLLEKSGFIRTHQSHLVNAKQIVSFQKSDGGYLFMSDKSTVPVATRFKEKVLQSIENI